MLVCGGAGAAGLELTGAKGVVDVGESAEGSTPIADCASPFCAGSSSSFSSLLRPIMTLTFRMFTSLSGIASNVSDSSTSKEFERCFSLALGGDPLSFPESCCDCFDAPLIPGEEVSDLASRMVDS